jgi:hypothetical protein
MTKFLVITQIVYHEHKWVDSGKIAINVTEIVQISASPDYEGEHCVIDIKDRNTTIFVRETFSDIINQLTKIGC